MKMLGVVPQSPEMTTTHEIAKAKIGFPGDGNDRIPACPLHDPAQSELRICEMLQNFQADHQISGLDLGFQCEKVGTGKTRIRIQSPRVLHALFIEIESAIVKLKGKLRNRMSDLALTATQINDASRPQRENSLADRLDKAADDPPHHWIADAILPVIRRCSARPPCIGLQVKHTQQVHNVGVNCNGFTLPQIARRPMVDECEPLVGLVE